MPDRRNAGVTKERNATTGTAQADASKRNGALANTADGLLGSLLLGHFLASILGPLMPLALSATGLSQGVAALDEYWLDRRSDFVSPANEPTYFPSYCLA